MFKKGHPPYYHNKATVTISKDGPLVPQDSIQAKTHPEISGTACWIIQGGGGTVFRYARKAWKERFGDIPQGIFVCHKCDNINGPCGNPFHLFLGTQKDNMADCSQKGRMYRPVAFLGRRPTSRELKGGWKTRRIRGTIGAHKGWKTRREKGIAVAEESILAIYKAGGPQRKIAKQYGISQQQVSRIKCGINCRQITNVA